MGLALHCYVPIAAAWVLVSSKLASKGAVPVTQILY